MCQRKAAESAACIGYSNSEFFTQARSMLSTTRTRILSRFLPSPKSQALQLSRFEIQILSNYPFKTSKTRGSMVRF